MWYQKICYEFIIFCHILSYFMLDKFLINFDFEFWAIPQILKLLRPNPRILVLIKYGLKRKLFSSLIVLRQAWTRCSIIYLTLAFKILFERSVDNEINRSLCTSNKLGFFIWNHTGLTVWVSAASRKESFPEKPLFLVLTCLSLDSCNGFVLNGELGPRILLLCIGGK